MAEATALRAVQGRFDTVHSHHEHVAEGRCGGLQSPIRRFDSARALQVLDVPVWWNRRHTALRTQRRKAWGFNSLYGYQSLADVVKLEATPLSKGGAKA